MKQKILILIVILTCVAAAWVVGFSDFFVAQFPINKEKSKHYYIHPLTKNVFFLELGDWKKNKAVRIEGVLSDNFQLVGKRHGHSGQIFIYNEKKFPEIAGDQAVLLTEDFPAYVKDERAVYFLQRFPTQLVRLEGAHSASFQRLGNPRYMFARDKNKIYRQAKAFKISDESVEILAEDLFRNGDQLIYLPQNQEGQSQKITLASASLIPVGFGYFDEKTIYFVDYKQQKIVAIEVKNPDSVRADGDSIVYDGTKLVPTASSSLQEP